MSNNCLLFFFSVCLFRCNSFRYDSESTHTHRRYLSPLHTLVTPSATAALQRVFVRVCS